MKLRIIAKKAKPFKGQDGKTVNYTWYTAQNLDADFRFEFGSTSDQHMPGMELELDVDKTPGGMWKEFIAK